MLIAKCNVAGVAGEPNYRQAIHCGRHALVADERPLRGGADAGPMPFEYLLAALGACTSITLRMYAERKDWDIGTAGVTLSVSMEKKDLWSIDRRVTLAVKAGVAVRTTLSSEGSVPPTPQ